MARDRRINPDQSRPPGTGALSYPYARDETGNLIHIAAHDANTPVYCLGCAKPMIAKGGKRIIRRHFAHQTDVLPTCNAQTVLHAAAKIAIRDGYASAQRDRRPYLLQWWCMGCGQLRIVDVATRSYEVANERSLARGTVSDVAFVGRRSFAVEVVVTHAPEDSALAQYEEARVPVFVVRPTFELIPTFANGIVANETYFDDRAKCPLCLVKREAEQAEVARRERTLARVDAELKAAQPTGTPRKWDIDRLGYHTPKLVDTLYSVALRLTRLGFRQAREKPWLFVFPIAGIGAVFVDAGGSKDVPSWVNTTPWLYVRLNSKVEEYEETILERVESYLHENGVVIRTGLSR